MFEMVIGEIESLLSYLGEEREFEEIVMEIWLGSNDEHETRSRFEALGQNLVRPNPFTSERSEEDNDSASCRVLADV